MNDRILEAIKKLKENQDDLSFDLKQLARDFEKSSSLNMQEAILKVADDLARYTIKDGYWYYNGKDTGIKAEGVDGKQGPQGIQGVPGKDGKDGKPGKDGKNGKDGKDGKPGLNGKDGKDGKDGKNGTDGKDGITPLIKIGKVESSDTYGGADVKMRFGKGNIIYLDFTLPMGRQGFAGLDGKDAKINGKNTIDIVAGDNITIEQEDDKLVINSEGGSGTVTDVKVNNESVVTEGVANINLTNYVKNTDYAGPSTGGVLKASAGLLVNASNGNAYCEERSYAQYQSSGGTAFISKGTLENVITGKGLVSNTNLIYDSNAGLVKQNADFGYGAGNSGNKGTIMGIPLTYSQYADKNNYCFISKGTLENVITGKELLSSSDVKNNVVSTDEDKPLSANMGKELNDRIQNLASIGKYLAMWDCTTGLPTTDPVTMPYTYTTGDYYVISNVGATNYMPNGSTYSGTASSTQYSGTETLNVGDFFYYDGTVWTMLKNTGKTVYFANIAGNPTDNSNLASALNGKVGFTDYATSSTGGVLKIDNGLGTGVSAYGVLVGIEKTYSQYNNAYGDLFISKGTLENVLGARFVTLTQSEYDALVSGGTVDANTYYFIEEE